MTLDYKGVEDCLYMYVHVPILEDNADPSLPVMVWIHGGAFFAGDGTTDFHGPDMLLDKNVVIDTKTLFKSSPIPTYSIFHTYYHFRFWSLSITGLGP